MGPLLLVIVLIHESILNKGLVGSWSCLSLSIKPGAQTRSAGDLAGPPVKRAGRPITLQVIFLKNKLYF